MEFTRETIKTAQDSDTATDYQILTDIESYYYETRCEDCEKAWANRMDRWMKGAEDDELDKLYDAPKPTKH